MENDSKTILKKIQNILSQIKQIENHQSEKSGADEKRHKELVEKVEKIEEKSELTQKDLNEKIKNIEDKIEESEKRSESRYKRSIGVSILAIVLAFLIFYIGVNHSIELYEKSTTKSIKLSEEEFKRSLQLSEESLNITYWLTSPVILKVNHTVKIINNSGEILINVTNTHPLKDTGAIYIYRLEMNPNRPFTIEKNLEPNESRLYHLYFKTKEEGIKSTVNFTPYGTKGEIPAGKLYLIQEHVSISYKISCDNCPSQGVIRREPPFSTFFVGFKLTNIGGKSVPEYTIDIYEWVDCELKEILRNGSINLSGIHNNTNTEKLNNETNKTLQISEIIISKNDSLKSNFNRKS